MAQVAKALGSEDRQSVIATPHNTQPLYAELILSLIRKMGGLRLKGLCANWMVHFGNPLMSAAERK